MPFLTTRIIPKQWSSHHQPAMKTSMNARCTILVGGTAPDRVWEETTGTWTSPARAVLVPDAPCRVVVRPAAAGEFLQAGQVITETDYQVSIPVEYPPVPLGSLITLTGVPNDSALSGLVLSVSDILRGSELFDRVYICNNNEG